MLFEIPVAFILTSTHNTMKSPFFYAALLAGILLSAACNPHEDPKPPVDEDFSCVRLVDDIGQDLGFYGCTTNNDWTYADLTQEESGYFLSNDTVSLTGTAPVQITGVAFFPNPIVVGSYFSFHLLSPASGTQVKLQLAIIDESRNVVVQVTQRIDVNGAIQLAVPTDKFQPGGFYRAYYRVSAQGAPVQFEGHGNFVVCKNYGTTNIDVDCI